MLSKRIPSLLKEMFLEFYFTSMTKLRFILGTNNTDVVDGISHELTSPLGQTSGYRIKMEVVTIE